MATLTSTRLDLHTADNRKVVESWLRSFFEMRTPEGNLTFGYSPRVSQRTKHCTNATEGRVVDRLTMGEALRALKESRCYHFHLVRLRYSQGRTLQQIAQAEKHDWRLIRNWLIEALNLLIDELW